MNDTLSYKKYTSEFQTIQKTNLTIHIETSMLRYLTWWQKRKFWSSSSCRSCCKLTLQVMAQYCKMQVAYADMIPPIILNATSWKELCSSKSLFFFSLFISSWSFIFIYFQEFTHWRNDWRSLTGTWWAKALTHKLRSSVSSTTSRNRVTGSSENKLH